jgi:hypothetical protein
MTMTEENDGEIVGEIVADDAEITEPVLVILPDDRGDLTDDRDGGDDDRDDDENDASHGVSEENSPESDEHESVAGEDIDDGQDRPPLGSVPTQDRPGICGTPRGYSRHLYAREKPCEACRRANSDAQSRRRETNPDIRRKALIESRATHRALAALRDAYREEYNALLVVAREESEEEQRRADRRASDRARRLAAKARKAAESGALVGAGVGAESESAA